jgi:hypothetical protein
VDLTRQPHANHTSTAPGPAAIAASELAPATVALVCTPRNVLAPIFPSARVKYTESPSAVIPRGWADVLIR